MVSQEHLIARASELTEQSSYKRAAREGDTHPNDIDSSKFVASLVELTIGQLKSEEVELAASHESGSRYAREIGARVEESED